MRLRCKKRMKMIDSRGQNPSTCRTSPCIYNNRSQSRNCFFSLFLLTSNIKEQLDKLMNLERNTRRKHKINEQSIQLTNCNWFRVIFLRVFCFALVYLLHLNFIKIHYEYKTISNTQPPVSLPKNNDKWNKKRRNDEKCNLAPMMDANQWKLHFFWLNFETPILYTIFQIHILFLSPPPPPTSSKSPSDLSVIFVHRQFGHRNVFIV